MERRVFVDISQIYFLILLTLVLAQRDKITIGVFMTDTSLPFGIHQSGPAVELGLRKLKDFVGEAMDIEIIQHVSPDGMECDPTKSGLFGKTAAEMYHLKNVTAVIGPTCSSSAEFIGRMAAEWNMPIFGSEGSSGAFEDKRVFRTLTKMAFDYNELSVFYLNLFSHFNWTDFTAMYEENATRLSPAVNLHNTDLARTFHRNILAAGLKSTLLEFSSQTEHGYQDVLEEANKTSRIFLVVSDSVALRGMMLKASSMGMTEGDYAFFVFFYYNGYVNGRFTWNMGDQDDQTVRKAFESVFLIGLYQSETKEYKEFAMEIKRKSFEEYNMDIFDQDPNPHAMVFYEALVLYGEVVMETVQDGIDFRDGLNIVRRLKNRTFDGINGDLFINAIGDRVINWMIMDLDPFIGEFVPVGYGGSSLAFHLSNSNTIHWPNDKGPPINKPRCGFTGADCYVIEDNKFFMVLSIVLAVLILAICNMVLLVYRKMKRDAEMLSNWWKIPWEDIAWLSQCHSRYSLLCFSEGKLKSKSEEMSLKTMAVDQKVASYQGLKVYLQKFNKKQRPSCRSFYMELSQLRSINCPNLTKFLGLTEHDSSLYSVTEFCPRGDLRDILSNDSFVLNREFSISLIRDIIQFHGHLHSRNCVIDSRFVLKVTNFGLQSLKDHHIDLHSEKCLWMAPELLRKSTTTSDHLEMQCADVYSFGIIMYEVLSRKEPFEDDKEFLTLEEIVTKVKIVDDVQFRPRLNMVGIDTDVVGLMKYCWEEDPNCRPTFQFLRKESRKLQWDKSGEKLLDNLLSRMEEYANNLEDLVEDRTQSLIIEKKKSDELLYQVLPRSVADKLKTGCTVEPEAYTCVTIYFSDIVGFTSLSSQSTPMQVIDLLNDLYICFDKIIEHFDVYKVETIGDAYMVVSGLPTRNGDQHVVEIAGMSCSILESVKNFKIKHKPDHRLCARIGMHSGPVCAGVVGQKMPRYCLFGDTVNTASRMESSGEPMKIHTSENTRNLLKTHQDFLLEERGEIQIKGKGMMRTYWLSRQA
ncbi:atrial natriuretic peptide receptor 1 isoform X2 [Magallana gigas]|uniref:atrial natriuretic peptide receptor 1 isoform X2 n=1 Tax=Magallana gigas TaxID=29159 RepID=UPI003341711E